jgi:hypothetical protein
MKNIIKTTLLTLLLVLAILLRKKSEKFTNYNKSKKFYTGNKNELDKNFAAMSEWLKNYKNTQPNLGYNHLTARLTK